MCPHRFRCILACGPHSVHWLQLALVKLPLAALCNTRLQDAKLSDTCLKIAAFWGHGRGSQWHFWSSDFHLCHVKGEFGFVTLCILKEHFVYILDILTEPCITFCQETEFLQKIFCTGGGVGIWTKPIRYPHFHLQFIAFILELMLGGQGRVGGVVPYQTRKDKDR